MTCTPPLLPTFAVPPTSSNSARSSQAHPSRVVVVSSYAHKLLQRKSLELSDLHYRCRRYWPYAAYSQSKTANILFAKHLAVR